ncbi:hypothetical protein NQ315_003130 [Exocentrus adspersus]|uniref:Gustatory receptor n=1 Tax=Exocentrus adspersus TaxID=1586481 RepID=A0AAV8W4I7_9CUCU|nr:hypothetical protein NQ315_003130 [Exocentrus adspersus]
MVYIITVVFIEPLTLRSLDAMSSLLKPLTRKLAFIFGSAPYYSFGKRKLLYRKLYKRYGLSLSVLMVVTIITSQWLYQQNVVMLNSLLTCLELLEVTTTTPPFYSNVSTVFLVFSIVQVMVLLGYLLCCVALRTFLFFIHILILHYASLTTAFFMYDVINLLRKQYADINNSLSDIRSYTVIKSGTVKELQRIHAAYTEVGTAAEVFNKVFGWPLLLMFAEATEMVLTSLDILIERGTVQTLNSTVSIQIISLIYISFSFIKLCGPTMIIFSCDAVLREANKVLRNCRLLQETAPLLTREMEELKRIENLVQNRRPKFTAANFFQINRSTLISIIGTTTTYMIVVLQFNFL